MTAPTRPAVTLYGKSWNAGYRAAIDGQPQQPPPGMDELAFFGGWIEGVADHRTEVNRRKEQEPADYGHPR